MAAQLAALEAALEMGEPWLDPTVVEQARASVQRSVMRIRLGVDHTVVALVGATGSGKSCLFNALARMEIAEVGARRPTTSLPMACVWGEGGSEELLDWLEVPAALRVTRESVLDADLQAPLHGLVLLDLPDHDSTEVIHRVAVDRLVTMVDLLVWVVDPQKYADDALHSGYLQRMVGHDGVMVVVLNQIDRLGADEADTCVRDLRRLLDGDGLEAVPMLPVSARRGDGVDELRTLLARVVQDRTAIAERVGADLRFAIEEVASGLAPAEPGNGTPPGADRLVADLAAAAGVPVVIDAVAAEYRRRGWIRARWPALPILRRLRRDRLGDAVDEQDLKLITSGLTPVSAPSLRPQVELAVETAIAATADGLPSRWADAVRHNVSRSEEDLVAGLDRSVSQVDLELSPPPWWWLATVVQYLLGLAAAVGAVWLVLLGFAGVINSDFVGPAPALGLPSPLLMLVIGLLGGALVTALSAWVLAVGARRRRLAAQERLNDAVRLVADERVLTPIQDVLNQHRLTRLALAGQHAELARPAPGWTGKPATPGWQTVAAIPADQASMGAVVPGAEPVPTANPGSANGAGPVGYPVDGVNRPEVALPEGATSPELTGPAETTDGSVSRRLAV
ncbi:MAG TPA: YfjP family GTPase [Kineosporiaceae bacterium]|nr:YfjP family GTPase [Kineosporiaceae bacterium]